MARQSASSSSQASANDLVEVWPELAPSVEWVHSFSAGVDGLAPFFATLRGSGGDGDGAAPAARTPVVTNGRGAFSSSLAEYVVWAMMHHNKRAEACVANRAACRWDKFVMPVLAGKTVGFVGFGHIAKTSVPLCRVLGMRVLTLRARAAADAEDADPSTRADETLCSTYGTVAREMIYSSVAPQRQTASSSPSSSPQRVPGPSVSELPSESNGSSPRGVRDRVRMRIVLRDVA